MRLATRAGTPDTTVSAHPTWVEQGGAGARSLLVAARRGAGAALRRLPGFADRFEHRPDPREPLVAEVVARIGAGDPTAAYTLAEQGERSRPQRLQLPDLRVALLDQLARPEEALALAVRQAQRRIDWLERRRGEPPPRRLNPHQRIFVSGCFKSGSSSVVGYLRGVSGVTKWTPGRRPEQRRTEPAIR